VVLALASCAGPDRTAAGADAVRFATRIAALTSRELGGRASGTAGGLETRRFVAAEFAAIGLEAPLAGGYEQRFVCPNPRPPTWDPQRTVLIAAGSPPAAIGREAVPFGFSAAGGAEAACVFAGYGLVASDPAYDDYEGIDVRGRIAVIVRGAPGWRDPDSAFRARHRDLVRSSGCRRVSGRRRHGLLVGAVASRGGRAWGDRRVAFVLGDSRFR
jgi:hypothetical protein